MVRAQADPRWVLWVHRPRYIDDAPHLIARGRLEDQLELGASQAYYHTILRPLSVSDGPGPGERYEVQLPASIGDEMNLRFMLPNGIWHTANGTTSEFPFRHPLCRH